MLTPIRRVVWCCILALSFLFVVNQVLGWGRRQSPVDKVVHPGLFRPKFRWKDVPQQHPVQSLVALPTGPLIDIPKIQHEFEPETIGDRNIRLERLNAVKDAFLHSWQGYKDHAWLQDEVAPLSGKSRNNYGGWAATLVDSLDTLWIMGLEKEFSVAVAQLKKIDYTTTDLEEINVFETTIRHLGGLLGAYDISEHKYDILLEKAVEVGDMLLGAFDTPNRMPVTRWNWRPTALGQPQEAARFALIAEVGSFTLEFTRLSQLTGDNRWYDAIARITDLLEDSQNRTKIPGLWPVKADTLNADFTRGTTFTLGGMADSLYEYLPKQHLLLGGRSLQYHKMYTTALQAAKDNLFFRPLNPENHNLLISGTLQRKSAMKHVLEAEGQHLTCFAGGMVALGAIAFSTPSDLSTAHALLEGCIWAYNSMPTGIMPETFIAIPCTDTNTNISTPQNPAFKTSYLASDCEWNATAWHAAIAAHANPSTIPSNHHEPSAADLSDAARLIHDSRLPPGILSIPDPRYALRPETIESLFILYRTTGSKNLPTAAWKMFTSITAATRTEIAFAGLEDVTRKVEGYGGGKQTDVMESYWTAETLKYFYLVFSEPHVVSLDEFVFNTEAHPLLRPTA